MMPRNLFPVFAIALLLAPTFSPASRGAAEPDAPTAGDPWRTMGPVLETFSSPTVEPQEDPGLSQMEGWGFDRTSSPHPLGRFTLRASWDGDADVAGVLRLTNGTTYGFRATRDPDAWRGRGLDAVVERYEGPAWLTRADGHVSHRILLDYVPSQRYVAGSLASHPYEGAPLSFHLFDSSTTAIDTLRDLLHTAAPAELAHVSAASSILPVPLLGQEADRPLALTPEGRTPDGDAPLLRVEVPGAPPQVPDLPDLHQPLSSATPNGADSTRSSSPSAGGAESSAGGPSRGGGGCGCGGGDDPPPPPPPPPSNQAPNPSQPHGPTLLPVGHAGAFVGRATDPDHDEVRLVFHWGDGNTTQTAFVPSGAHRVETHAWTAPGTYAVTVVAVDTKGATSGPSAPWNVVVVAVPVPDPNDYLPPLPDPHDYLPDAPPDTPPLIPPERPARPYANDTRVLAGSPVNFTAITTDKAGASVRYRFSWDDNTTTWTPWVASGQPAHAEHAWSSSGAKRVQVQAQNLEGCNGSPGTVLTCTSLWSDVTLVHVRNPGGTPPAQPAPASGWTVVARNATAVYRAHALHPDGYSAQVEFDWGDFSASSLSSLAPNGQPVEVAHSWDRPGMHALRVRAIDQQGTPGPWSEPVTVRVGTRTQPYEVAVAAFSVDNPTPRSTNLTDPTDPLSVEPGETIQLSATVENRGPQPVTVDVTFLDDGKPFDSRPWTIGAGNTVTATSLHPMADALGTGVHQLSVQVAQDIPPDLEVAKSNNQRFLDIRVREPVTGSPAYGALYDGRGPPNAEGLQLVTGLYQRYRADDANTYDEIPHGGSTPMRLLVWSPELAGTPNQTWYFADSVHVRVTASAGLSLANPQPAVANVTLADRFPLTLGYSERAGNGRTQVGMDYHVQNVTLSAAAASLEWRIATNRTPSSPTQAVGFRFDVQAATSASGSLWREIQHDVSINYTRIERIGDGRLLLWHEIARSGNAPVRSTLEAGTFSPASVPYAQGLDYNVGDRSMTSLPVWDASLETRRTYYDGTTDKNAQDENATGDAGASAAYHWFRLDGPIYQSHDLQWVFTGPNNETFNTSVYHFAGPTERGYPDGTFFAWAQFRAGLRFNETLVPEYRGAWTSHVLIDGRPTSLLTFHVLAQTNDPTDGPHNATDEELAERMNDAMDPAVKADPTNEDLPELDPVHRNYLETNRVDGKIEATEERVDDAIATYVSQYLANQLEELANITMEIVDPIIPEPVTHTFSPILYDVVETLREPPSTQRVTRTVTRAVWDAVDATLAACAPKASLTPLPDAGALVADVMTTDATSCVSHVAATLANATALVTGTTSTLLDVANATLATLPVGLDYASGLADVALQDPLAAVTQSVGLANATVADASQAILEILPQPPVPVNLHPKHLADNAALVYDALMQAEASEEAKNATVSSADALFYNLYVAHDDASRAWTVLNVPLGNATLLDVDHDGATGVQGQDLLVVVGLAPDLSEGEVDARNASRLAPFLHVRSLGEAARHAPLLACAYVQLPVVPHVAVTCLDTRNATLASLGASMPSQGFPDHANATFRAYVFDAQDDNVTATLRLDSSTGARPAVPVLAMGGIFEVNLTHPQKPRVGTDVSEASLYAATGRGLAELALQRRVHDATGASTAWTWTTHDAGHVQASYRLVHDGRTLVASSNATSPATRLTFQAARNADDTGFEAQLRSLPPVWLGRTTFAMSDSLGQGEALSLSADALPAAWTLRADDPVGSVSLAAEGGSIQNLHLVQTHGRDACAAPTTPNRLARHGADASGGACLALRLGSHVHALQVDLATGGPSLALTSPATTQDGLGIVLRQGQARSLDATFSQTPSAALIRSSLAQPDGSTTFAWSASDVLDQARVLARSGSTVLLWNATQAPTALQGAYQWAADLLTLQAPAGNPGTAMFLLTNTGSIPTLPAGDYVAGVHAAPESFAAAARLSGVHDLSAQLATQDYRIDAAGSAGAPLAIRYARAGGPAFSLDADALPADRFRLRAAAQEGGTHRLDYDSGSRGANLSWTGRWPQGAHVEADVRDAPAGFAFATAPASGTLAFDAAGDRAGRLRLTRALAGASVATLAGDDVVHLQSTSMADVYRASLADVRAFALAKTPNALATTATQTAEHPLRVQVGGQAAFFYGETTTLPPSVRLTYGRTGLNYTAAASTPPSWSVRVVEDGNAFGFTGQGMPTQVGLGWTSSTLTANLTGAHNGATLPLLHLEGNFAPPEGDEGRGNEFFRIRLENASRSVRVAFDGTSDEITAQAGPAPSGVLVFQHATHAASLLVPNEPNHVLMTRASATADGPSATQALRLENVTQARLRLGAHAGEPNQLLLHATSPHPFYASYATDTGSLLRARYSNLPGQTDLRYALATNQGNATGMQVRQEGSGTMGSLLLHAEQGGFAFDLNASSAPPSWSLQWAPGQPFDLRASMPMGVHALAYRAAGEAAPLLGTGDFVVVDVAQPRSPRVGARLASGVTRAQADAARGLLDVAHVLTSAPFRLAHVEAGVTHTLQLSTPPGDFLVVAPPPATAGGAVALDWRASGATGALAWGLDAPHGRWRWTATGAPASVAARLESAQGTFSLEAPGGAGSTFRLQHTSDPTGGFYGSGPGLVLLAHPKGTEGYPAGVTTFTLDAPHVTQARATFTGPHASGERVGAFTARLERTPTAPALGVTVVLASGPEALRLTAGGARQVLNASWASSDATGFRGTVETSHVLQDVSAQYRGKDGLVQARAGSVTTQLDVRVSASRDGASADDKRVRFDYSNGGSASLVTLRADALGVLADVRLTSAARELHVDAPLRCAASGSSGRAWTTGDESHGRVELVLVPRDAPSVPHVAAPQRVVATCEANAATIQIDASQFREAAWASAAASGAASASLTTSTSTSQPARLVVTTMQHSLVLDAYANAPPATWAASSIALGNATLASWTASAATPEARITLLAPGGFLNATLTSAPTSWTLGADADASAPLHYTASGTAGRVVANVGTAPFAAHVDAQAVPRDLVWTLPVTVCPDSTQALEARVSTQGTGPVGQLTYWTVPGGSAQFVDDGTAEYALLQCDDQGARSTASLTGMQEVSWSRSARPSGVDGAWSKGIDVARDAGVANVSRALAMRLHDLDDEHVNATIMPPVVSFGIAFDVTADSISARLHRDGAVPQHAGADYRHQDGITRAIFLRPAASTSLSLLADGSDLHVDYAAAEAADAVHLRTRLGGQNVELDMTKGIPPRVIGAVVGGPPPLGASSTTQTSNSPQPGRCLDEADMGVLVNTQNTGPVGQFQLRSGAGHAPRLPTPSGATYACENGSSPGVTASMSDVENFEMTGNSCATRVLAPANSEKPSDFTLRSPTFEARVRVELARTNNLPTTAIIDASVAEDSFYLRTLHTSGSLNPEAVMKFVLLEYNQLARVNASGGASCLTFGSSAIDRLDFHSVNLTAWLDANLGSDSDGRPQILLEGGGAGKIYLNLITAPKGGEESSSTEFRPVFLNLDARLPISGALDVAWQETGVQPPSVPPAVRVGHYAVLGDTSGMKGGRFRIVGLESAHLLLERTAMHSEIKTTVDVQYSTTGQARPLYVIFFGDDGLRVDVTFKPLPSTVSARTKLYEARSHEGVRGSIEYHADLGTLLTLRQFQPSKQVTRLSLDAPANIDNLMFDTYRNRNNDWAGTINYKGDLAPRLAFEYMEGAGASTMVEVKPIPQVITNAEFTITSCGLDIKLPISDAIQSATVRHKPGTTHESPHVTPGCPTTGTSSASSDSTEFFVFLKDIPAGTLKGELKTGHGAGRLRLDPLPAPIGEILVTTNTSGKKNTYTYVRAEDVRIRLIEWDVDGHTTYPGMPQAIFLDSVKQTTGRITFSVIGKDTIRVDTNGRVFFDKFLVKIPTGWFDWELHAAGCMKLLDHDLTISHSVRWKNAAAQVYTAFKGQDWRCW